MSSIIVSSSMDDNGNDTCKRENSVSKKREFKGTSANTFVKDYCVLDLETTGVFVGSSKIIEISALKVRDNQIIDEYSTLINPQCHIPAEATAVNHITDEMVNNAPTLDEKIDEVLEFLGDDIIVGYNNASFDMNLIYDSALKFRGIYFNNDFIDLLHVSRRSIEGLENYKLETVCKHYGLDTTGEHRALKDCYLTKECYNRIIDEFGDSAFVCRKRSYSGKHIRYNSETLAVRELLEILEEILVDGIVSLDEVDVLRFWLEEHRDLSGVFPFDKAFNAINDVLEDGIITPEELEDLKRIFTEILDPVKAQSCRKTITSLQNIHICLSGEFNYGSKNDVKQLIIEAGGLIDNNVKKATNYLVVGAKGSDAWKTGKYGGKVQKAMEYNSKGTDIKIIEEKDFIPMVEYIINNSKVYDCEITEGVISESLKVSIENMLKKIVQERDLPNQSLYLMENFGRDKNSVTSYSVCIYEPEYPMNSTSKKDNTRNSIVLNFKNASNQKIELLVGKKQFDNIDKPEEAEIKHLESDTLNVHILFSIEYSSALILYIKKLTEHALDNYKPIANTFGCCNKYIECSNEKHCIHENQLYSKACEYRKYLEAGIIFYGKNKTIN